VCRFAYVQERWGESAAAAIVRMHKHTVQKQEHCCSRQRIITVSTVMRLTVSYVATQKVNGSRQRSVLQDVRIHVRVFYLLRCVSDTLSQSVSKSFSRRTISRQYLNKHHKFNGLGDHVHEAKDNEGQKARNRAPRTWPETKGLTLALFTPPRSNLQIHCVLAPNQTSPGNRPIQSSTGH
jgi:hypothetical protein